MPGPLGLMAIKGWSTENESLHPMVLLGFLQKLCRLASAKNLSILRMDAGSSSAIAPVTPNPVETKVRDLKHDLKALQNQVNAIDYEGGRRLEHVSKDLAFLRKKIKQKMKRTENSLTRKIVELEIKANKLALKLVKHEAFGIGMSSNLVR